MITVKHVGKFLCSLTIILIMSCDDLRKMSSSINQVEVVSKSGRSLYLTKNSVGLNGNHNEFIVSTQPEGDRVNRDSHKGVERVFYRCNADTLFLKLEHKLPINRYEGWTIKQSVYKGSELVNLMEGKTTPQYQMLD